MIRLVISARVIRVLHLHKQCFLDKFSLHGRVRFEIVHLHEQDFLDKLSFVV